MWSSLKDIILFAFALLSLKLAIFQESHHSFEMTSSWCEDSKSLNNHKSAYFKEKVW